MSAPSRSGSEQECRDLQLTRVNYRFDYPFGPADVVEFFRENYGPTTRAFASLGEADRAALRADLVQLWTSHNTATDPGRTDRRLGISRGRRHSRVTSHSAHAMRELIRRAAFGAQPFRAAREH